MHSTASSSSDNMSAYDWGKLWHTIQHRTVLIIFPLILQRIITTEMLTVGREGGFGDERNVN